MVQGLIGKKLGMTQIFTDDGQVIPVTVIKVGPCVVVQKKDYKDFKRVQLGFVEDKKVKKVNKPTYGHFKNAKVPPTKILKEFDLEDDSVKLGDSLTVDVFEDVDKVNVVGTTKGKGFQGVVKRWNFSGGRSTHGSMFHRKPGSIGMCAYPGKVLKGKKLPGRMGGKRKTVMGLKVIEVDKENNLLLVRGAVPGHNGNYVYVLKNSFRRR